MTSSTIKSDKERLHRHFEQRLKEIASRWKDKAADWRDVAALILEWERAQPLSQRRAKRPPSPDLLDHESGQEGIPDGMNKWLQSLADLLGLQISNLWRYRKAVISAREIWNTGDLPVKSAFDIPEHVGPESIELAEKISRAAPSEIIGDVAERLYQNEITRSELRKIWQNIRHVVKDEKRKIPVYHKLPLADRKRRGQLFEELCYESLRKNLLKSDSPVLGGRGVCFRDRRISLLMVDIVAVIKDEDGDALYHAIETKLSLTRNQRLDAMTSVLQHFDFLWIIVPKGTKHFEHVPESIGILKYVDGQVELIREAIRNPEPNLKFVSRSLIPELIQK